MKLCDTFINDNRLQSLLIFTWGQSFTSSDHLIYQQELLGQSWSYV